MELRRDYTRYTTPTTSFVVHRRLPVFRSRHVITETQILQLLLELSDVFSPALLYDNAPAR